ncbi:MAG: SDR family oxidoreductase [Oceanococcaceae bacterium]
MTDTLFSLQGKVALVTGASRGIGEASARLLAQHGAHVIISSRRQEACEAVAQSIREQGGLATAMACHAGQVEDMQRLVNSIVSQLGRLDVLVNNAATNPHFGNVLDTPLEAIDKTVEVNLRGYFVLSQLAGRQMREQGGGTIVNIASVNGINPGRHQGIYSVTKAAVINMTQAFAKECAEFGIRCNAVLPGLTDTKFASALTRNDALLEKMLPIIPAGRYAEPTEIAPAVLYLASAASSYVTGTTLTVDGGLVGGGGL